MVKCCNIIILSLILILGFLSIKYKVMYKVSISGTDVGYLQDKEALEEVVKESILKNEGKNVDDIDLKANPEYTLEFVDKSIETKDEDIVETVKQDSVITYKYYEIALNNETINKVNTMEEAEELSNKVKEEYEGQEELELSIIEKHTDNEEEVDTCDVEVAKIDIKERVAEELEKQKEEKAEDERIKSMPEINGIKLAYEPISGTISSRYGVSSRIRSSDHTGLDIAASTGTPIKVVASGTVTCATYKGSYGNIVKVDHGNGLETWYAHTSKMYVTVGEKVEAGEVIAAVGSTGNSTGPHLHLEIRINGKHVNPQKYLYNK